MLIFSTASACLPVRIALMFKMPLCGRLFHKAALILAAFNGLYFKIKLETSSRLWPTLQLTTAAMHYSYKCDTPPSALQLQGCRHNRDTAGNQLCPLCILSVEAREYKLWTGKWERILLLTTVRTGFAAGPWNQSSRLSEGGKLIPVAAQVVKPAEGFTVSYILLTEVSGFGLWILLQ